MDRTRKEGASRGDLSPQLRTLLDAFEERRRPALARAISIVEDERTGFQDLLDALLRVDGRGGARVGVTGPPGAGKSSLLAALSKVCREADEDVGVVAVDPTSPFSGGALLGDRIRMNDIAMDPGIFIRSMASRGSLGGLATTTKEVVDVMDAFGFPRLFIETVGVGQAELEIAAAADTVVVVLVPESGDGIQAMKAGLMEIADIFVVNKADRPGADRLQKEIALALQLRQGQAMKQVPAHHGVDRSRIGGKKTPRAESAPAEATESETWKIPILPTIAQTGEGVPELLEALDEHRGYLERSGELKRRRRERARRRVRDVVERELRRLARAQIRDDDALEKDLDRIVEGDATPYTVARRVLEQLTPEEGAARLPADEPRA